MTARKRFFAVLGLVLLLPLAAESAPEKSPGDVWVAGWQETTPLNIPRAGAAIVKAGSVIYAIGGIDGRDFLRTVEYTRIRRDGSLAPWRLTAPLNEPRGFFDAVFHKGYLYAVGGANGPGGKNLLRSVERARIQKDGSLGPWQRLQAALVYPRRCIKLALIGDTLYALGGFGGALLDSVESARIRPDGALAPWTLDSRTLTMPRYVNTVKTVNDTVYVIGGHKQAEGSGRVEVEFARAASDHSISPWKATSAMAFGRYALAASAHGRRLYALGGLQGPVYTDVVESTTIDTPSGGLAPWRATTALSSPRANFGAIVHGDFIYIIGGTNRDGYYRTAEYAMINESGDIGFWADPATAAAHAEQREARKRARQPRLPNGGRVTQIIHTSLYSYIEVEDKGLRRWIAAPRSDFKTGDQIRYSRGVTMSGFHSKTLQRDFATIIFVEQARKAGGNP